MDKLKKELPLAFIGPRSENRPLVLEVINLIFNDHIFWRRNYHPQDPPIINYSELMSNENIAFKENLINELFKLLAELKLDPPFFSPRYMAHMISEPLLPGLIAYMATIFYNPNNVASEASTVTMKYELEVGKQLAKLFEYDSNKSFGHLTSGGTVANYESLYYNINLRLLPLSLLLFLRSNGVDTNRYFSYSFEELCNIPYERYDKLLQDFQQVCLSNNISPQELKNYCYASLGLLGFDHALKKYCGRHLPELKIIVPASSHYSWSRGAKLIGLGTNNLIKIQLNENFQMDRSCLAKEIKKCHQQNHFILQCVGVYGTTELGSFDPIDSIVEVRQQSLEEGLYFPIHVDAAYGGYFSSLFHENGYYPDHFSFFSTLKEIHRSLHACESITVDPHKLGYAPYGAGAFIFKHGNLKDIVAESAAYCFSPKGDTSDSIQLGKYILEGSKPGASAAAVYFNHKIIPLNYNGHGKILEKLCQTAGEFYAKLIEFQTGQYELIPLTEPSSNIVCFFIKPIKDKKVSTANTITEQMAAEFGIKDIKGIQEYEYIVSNTTINFKNFSNLPESISKLELDCDHLSLIRMVFMNVWHTQKLASGKNHLDNFLEILNSRLNR